jgi:hypothetical protein
MMRIRDAYSLDDFFRLRDELNSTENCWLLGVGMHGCQLCKTLKELFVLNSETKFRELQTEMVWFEINTVNEYIESRLLVDYFPTILVYRVGKLLLGWDGFCLDDCQKDSEIVAQILAEVFEGLEV